MDAIVKRNKELGATHVALTEHGNTNGIFELVKSCKENGMKPAPGIELYLESPFKDVLQVRFEAERVRRAADGRRAMNVEKMLAEAYVHLTVLFKDEWAYQYFCRLSPIMEQRAVVRYGERKPLMTWDELTGAAGHIVVGSGCPVGYVQKWVLPGRHEVRADLAELAYCQLREAVGPDNFFVEVLPHVMTHEWLRPVRAKDARWALEKGTDAQVATLLKRMSLVDKAALALKVSSKADNEILKEGTFVANECCPEAPDGDRQKMPNRFVLEMAAKYGDRAIISLDSHFALPSQKLIQTAKISNGQENWVFHESYHVMPTEEAAEKLRANLGVSDETIEGWVDNSYSVADQLSGFSVKTNSDRWVLNSECGSEISQLKPLMDRHGRTRWGDPREMAQLKHEIHMMRHNRKGINLLPYFFLVEDVANFCRENDILMTVRGSAGGSLLLYNLGVSAVNPLKHDLSFGRFITEGRIVANTMPDTDIDISTTGRGKVLQYLKDKYGDKFCQISTDSVLKLRSSIKDAERAFKGAVSRETEALCKTLPNQPQSADSYDFVFGAQDKAGHHVPGVFDTNEKLRAYAKANPEIWETVSEMLGINRQKGVHACGVVIADKPVQEYCPITYVSDTRVTGFAPKSVELAGLIKFDFLGLNTLDDIQGALRSIRSRTGESLDPWNLPYDREVVEEFVKGHTETVFQFDTDTVRPYLMNIMKAEVQNDLHSVLECLAAVTSLCRPGCLDAPTSDGRTLAEVYVACANGEPVTYVHQDLEPILKDTFGVQLFQEQSMRIFKDLAGYSDEQAETVRRGIGKKEDKVLASCMGDLKKGCLARGWTESQVELLMDQISASARYSFNKSHATSYAYIAYACMYLKTRYKLDWWKSVLSHSDKSEMVTKFWKYVSKFVSMPNLSKISRDFEIDGSSLVAPISIVTGIGEKAYDQLVVKAPYVDLDGFVKAHFGARGADDARSAIHTGVVHKLVAAGILDSVMPDAGATVPDKIQAFEVLKCKHKGRKAKVEPVPEEYHNITSLGRYMLLKQTVGVYSDDLRPIVLENRGGYLENGRWFININGRKLVVGDGESISKIKGLVEKGMGPRSGMAAACLAYVVSEKVQQYRQKGTGEPRSMTKLVLDSGGVFWEEVIWPPRNGAYAPTGYKGLPVMITYGFTSDRYYVNSINPLVDRGQENRYDLK